MNDKRPAGRSRGSSSGPGGPKGPRSSAKPHGGGRPSGKPSEGRRPHAAGKPGHGARPPAARGGERPSRQSAQNAGLGSRYLALTVIEYVLRDRVSLDFAIPKALADERFAALDGRDKAFARLLSMTVLRRHATLQAVLDTYLSKPLADNADRIRFILLAGIAELTILSVPPHAAISTAVELTRISHRTQHFDKLANAVLRRASENGAEVLAEKENAVANVPDWMLAGWGEAYGDETANEIAAASLREAPLDITVKDDPIGWAARLDAIVLPTGTIRRAAGGRIEELDGYNEGAWWVQDAAAALPAKLLGAQSGERVLDLCAAPGGKTAQLCVMGADVTAVDVSATRMDRLRANLSRLGLHATIVPADATTHRSTDLFDRILIDAPCTATGTIRRHPDILHLKQQEDVARLAEMQGRLLRNAANLLKPGGTLVYCTCSLEPDECDRGVNAFIEKIADAGRPFERQPIQPAEVGNQAGWITPVGDLRTLPFYLPHENPALAGLDGFYAARLVRTA